MQFLTHIGTQATRSENFAEAYMIPLSMIAREHTNKNAIPYTWNNNRRLSGPY